MNELSMIFMHICGNIFYEKIIIFLLKHTNENHIGIWTNYTTYDATKYQFYAWKLIEIFDEKDLN